MFGNMLVKPECARPINIHGEPVAAEPDEDWDEESPPESEERCSVCDRVGADACEQCGKPLCGLHILPWGGRWLCEDCFIEA